MEEQWKEIICTHQNKNKLGKQYNSKKQRTTKLLKKQNYI